MATFLTGLFLQIREEYERLQREKEERRLQQLTNPTVNGVFLQVILFMLNCFCFDL